MTAFSQGRLQIDLSLKSRIAIWGRHRGITVIAVLIWSANLVAATWSASNFILFLFFLGLISYAYLYRYYKGERIAYFCNGERY